MPHVTPLDRAELPQFAELFERYDRIRGFLPNSILTMGRRPAIAEAFMRLNQAILYEGTVPEALKMMVAYMASSAAGCRYCQAHMANLSSVYGVADDKIRAIWEFETSDLFSDAEKAALRLALHAGSVPNTAAAAHFDALEAHFTDAEIVEIVASIALFGYLNRWNDTMATEIEGVPQNLAERAIAPAGWQAGKHGAQD
ncbi:carboxymuconolactone decarboxylase family protein [Nitratireductor mangrovi]|uniref:Carboxymuconolactone decarboxylase family protein n=1 Tax=Nitratireductor mangrovi TaxID=2599600 RepID=A0A5B8KV14_9HYPH|nr:carboxymuconolactone decarboxylase family protein [Nitratireductor mangrovi]QDY99473.1 carboxymuconolactone decarboxylase family protein [Nitratireductor mangrovi]